MSKKITSTTAREKGPIHLVPSKVQAGEAPKLVKVPLHAVMDKMMARGRGTMVPRTIDPERVTSIKPALADDEIANLEERAEASNVMANAVGIALAKARSHGNARGAIARAKLLHKVGAEVQSVDERVLQMVKVHRILVVV